MVRQAQPDVQRRHRHRPTCSLVSTKFMHVPANQGDPAAKTHRDSLSRRVKGGKSRLVDKQNPEQAKELGISEDDVIKKVMLKETVDGEFTTTEDVANAVLFF